MDKLSKTKPWIDKTIKYNKGTSGGMPIPEFKLCYRAIAKKKKTWHTINGIELSDPGINPHTCGYIISEKKPNFYNGTKKASLTNCTVISGYWYV